jgi:hypothetical protein
LGAPLGNTNSATGKDGRRALEFALDNYCSEEPKELVGRMATLVLMWKPIIEKAMAEGDLAAMKEINDRLDGRPAQSIAIGGDAENPLSLVIAEISGKTLGPNSE